MKTGGVLKQNVFILYLINAYLGLTHTFSSYSYVYVIKLSYILCIIQTIHAASFIVSSLVYSALYVILDLRSLIC